MNLYGRLQRYFDLKLNFMNIYIDEAGVFIPPQGKRRYSLVLALVVPTATEAELFYSFLRLRDSWPEQAVEIKGSKLNEGQTAQVVPVLAAHDVIVEYRAIDMALHPNEVIDEFKERQAAALTDNLTPSHAEALVRRLRDDAQAIRAMSNPLFVQAFLTIELILNMLDVAVNYYAQRRPSELGRFAWTIDQKDRSITQMEQLWSTLILPFGESRSAQRPYARVEGFDYSHFAKYEIAEGTADEEWKRHLQWMRKTLPFSKAVPKQLICVDSKRILTEERAFSDSRSNLGLQLADVVANTLCRALNGNLQPPGWEAVSQLLIRQWKAPLILLGRAASQHRAPEPHGAMVWRKLDAKSKAMILEPSSP